MEDGRRRLLPLASLVAGGKKRLANTNTPSRLPQKKGYWNGPIKVDMINVLRIAQTLLG
jgi:hypothetical protein